MTDESLVTTVLRRHIVTEDLEHDGVCGNEAQLIEEVVLILIGPSVDIIGLNFDLEGPVWLVLFVAKLVKLGELHN